MPFAPSLLLLLLCGLVLAVPVPEPDDDALLVPPTPISGADVGADTGASSSSVDNALGMILDAGSINTVLFGPLQQIIEPTSPASDPIPSAPSGDQGFLYYYSLQLPSSQLAADTMTDMQTQTQTVTEPPTTTTATMTITVSAAPSTRIDVVTVFVSTSSSPASLPPLSSAPVMSTTPAPNAKATLTTAPNANTTSTTVLNANATWAAPAQIANLTMFSAVFNISGRLQGQKEGNVALVTGIPASATTGPKGSTSTSVDSLAPAFLPMPTSNGAPPNPSSSNYNPDSYMPWDNASTVFQVLYPQNSINPGTKPFGGAQFYAAPLNIADAQAVQFTYSVFFPLDFDWVKAGKLPGLFGGRPSCSGGDAATDCFSTRLMWRQDGMGELYLYAPKDKQTRALCRDPQSECNADYGCSIGRKSFKWRAGGWTTVTQILSLNRPGKQDGVFALYVDGQRRIWREDVYYRGPGPNAAKSASASASTSNSDDDGDDDDGDLLGLKTLLPGLLDRRTMVEAPFLLPAPTTSVIPEPTDDVPGREWAIQLAPTQTDLGAGLLAETATTTTTVTTTVLVGPTLLPVSNQAAVQQGPVGCVGIFFSTFFGGHTDDYKTPRDQYVWFKDFGLKLLK